MAWTEEWRNVRLFLDSEGGERKGPPIIQWFSRELVTEGSNARLMLMYLCITTTPSLLLPPPPIQQNPTPILMNLFRRNTCSSPALTAVSSHDPHPWCLLNHDGASVNNRVNITKMYGK
ncbi:hypothetical protein V6N13_119208 [Hibiscus sabdariffa]